MFDFSIFAFPISAILAVALLLVIFLISKSKGKLHDMLSGREISVAAILVAAIMTTVEGTWKLTLQHNIFFLIIITIIMIPLGLSVPDAVKKKKRLSFILCHLGFFLIVFGAFWSTPDYQDVIMEINRHEDSYLAYDASTGLPVPLPFKVRLQEFSTDYYEDGISPKQFRSVISVDGETKTTEVNSPCLHKGWLIYQYNYDRNSNDVSILKFVKDPWLPLILLGMLMLASGALLGLGNLWKTKWLLPVVIVLVAAFTAISIAKINFGTLMPALRSLWFVPHLAVYMLAYSLLATALVTGVLSLIRKDSSKLEDITSQLLGTSSSLLIVGMLCGAVWAKFAWGDYWTWDAKECWAASTWLFTLAGTHFSGRKDIRKKIITLTILIAFLAMQVTWYGVNYLPSAQFSLHTYR